MGTITIKEEGLKVHEGFSINTFFSNYKFVKGIQEKEVDGKIELSFLTIG